MEDGGQSDLLGAWSALGLDMDDLSKVLGGSDHCGMTEMHFFDQASRAGSVLISPLHDAASNGELAMIDSLLASDPLSVDARDAAENTPFLWSAACGHVDAMKKFLSAGADLNARNSHGDTALHRACWRSQVEAVRYLIDVAHIDENIVNKQGKKAVDLIRSPAVALLFTVGGPDGFCCTDSEEEADSDSD